MNGRFRILRIHGPYPLVHGFLSGFLAGRGLAGRVFYCEKEKIEAELGGEEGLAEKLAEWVGFQKYLATGVVVEEELYSPVLEGLKSAREELGLEVEASRVVREARLEARFRTFSKEEGAEIRRIVENAPEGVRILPRAEIKEERHQEAAGIEAYAPEHDYVLSGSTSFAGPVDRIVELRKLFAKHPLIHSGPIRLEME
jgi:hypothetical protein